MANKVTLQFQTPQDFSKFRNLVSNKVIKSSIINLCITCECTDEEIAHAMNYMGAKVTPEAGQ